MDGMIFRIKINLFESIRPCNRL